MTAETTEPPEDIKWIVSTALSRPCAGESLAAHEHQRRMNLRSEGCLLLRVEEWQRRDERDGEGKKVILARPEAVSASTHLHHRHGSLCLAAKSGEVPAKESQGKDTMAGV